MPSPGNQGAGRGGQLQLGGNAAARARTREVFCRAGEFSAALGLLRQEFNARKEQEPTIRMDPIRPAN